MLRGDLYRPDARARISHVLLNSVTSDCRQRQEHNLTLRNETDVLLTVPPFTALDPPQLKLLAGASERLQFEVGEILVAQGETEHAVYVILEGTADVSIETEDGPRVVRQLVRHAFVGEIAFLDEVARTATVVATSELVALKIQRDVVMRLIDEVPALADSIAAHKERSGYVYD